MKKVLIFAAVIVAFVLYSCSSSDSEPVDPCEGVTCFNGGYCQTGDCVCPEGYSGADCSIEKVPVKITITKIVVQQFENYNSAGEYWDSSLNGLLPDIYVSVLRNSGQNFEVVYESDTYFPDAISPGMYSFDCSIDIYNMSSPYVLSLFNYNIQDVPATDDDYMGDAAFYPYDPGAGFPLVKNVELGSIKAKIYLAYYW